jgi:hypothetical protein
MFRFLPINKQMSAEMGTIYKRALAGIIMILLLLFSGCNINPSISIFQQSTSTPVSTKETIFTAAFPPSTPLICPGASATPQNASFVQANHTQLMYQEKPLRLYGYTFYPALNGGSSAWHVKSFTHYIDQILDLGAQAGQNVLRPTDFWGPHYHEREQDDITIWKNMDYLVCAAAQRGVFMIMDISSFEWFLVSQGHDRYDLPNWRAFINAVGKHYANQPSIAFYSIVGEPSPPKNVAEMKHLVDFYRATTDELHQADNGHHLISAGGFNHMDDETPQRPWWQEIYSLPNNNIADFKTYSLNDLQLIPTITTFTEELDKPAIDEEFGMPQNVGDGMYSGIAYNKIQTSRAQFYRDVYTRGEQNGVVGFIFWNLGCQLQSTGYDVSPRTPAVWQAIQQHAPNILLAPAGNALC